MPTDTILLRCSSCRTLNRVPADMLNSRPICGQCKTPLQFPVHPVNATAASFDQEINDWPESVLVEFWAKWCGYCRMVEPVVNDIAAWNAGRLKVLRVDVDAEPALAQRFIVKATPTFLFYKNGRQLGRIDGAPKEKLELVQWVERLLKG
jgi:thioredoxin 2